MLFCGFISPLSQGPSFISGSHLFRPVFVSFISVVCTKRPSGDTDKSSRRLSALPLHLSPLPSSLPLLSRPLCAPVILFLLSPVCLCPPPHPPALHPLPQGHELLFLLQLIHLLGFIYHCSDLIVVQIICSFRFLDMITCQQKKKKNPLSSAFSDTAFCLICEKSQLLSLFFSLALMFIVQVLCRKSVLIPHGSLQVGQTQLATHFWVTSHQLRNAALRLAIFSQLQLHCGLYDDIKY